MRFDHASTLYKFLWETFVIVCCRKQDFRELKQLQREEMKEATDFYTRIRLDKEAQDRKFELESQVTIFTHCCFCAAYKLHVFLGATKAL